MNIADFAASAVRKIGKHTGKKLAKSVGAPEIPKSEPVRMKNPTDEFYNLGFAKREVMPDDIETGTYWLAGYRTGNKVVGVLDPLTVSAIWLDCKDNGGIIFVSADCVGLTGFEVDLVRASLADFSKKTGCVNISISCTHTHASIDTVGYWGKLPKTGKSQKYMEKFLDAIKQVCMEAYENKKEGRLFIGSKHVPECIEDRREPIVCNDRLTRLRFVPNDGSEETWFLNYGAHPNCLGGANSKVSADYPYFLRERINKEKKTNVLFSVNAILGVDIAPLCEDRYERTKLGGEKLAEAAMSIDNDEQLAPEITVLNQPYYAPIDNGVLALMAIIHVCNSKKYACDKGDLGMALKTEMDFFKLDKLNILTLPGEAASEFVYGGYSSAETSATGKGPEINPPCLVDIVGDKDLLVMGVSNDMTGYMVPPNDFILHETQPYLSTAKDRFDRRHYHETNSLGYLTPFVVADVLKDMVERLK